MTRPPRETDYMQQLINYIKKNLSKGYTLESLKWALINQGYSRTEVDKAIKFANEQLALQAPKLVEKPVIKHEIIVEPSPEETEKKGFWKKIKKWFG